MKIISKNSYLHKLNIAVTEYDYKYEILYK